MREAHLGEETVGRVARVGIVPDDFLVVRVNDGLRTLTESGGGVPDERLDERLNGLDHQLDPAA